IASAPPCACTRQALIFLYVTARAWRRKFAMDMKGEYRVAAPRQKVWDALNDPEILKQCIPGCETLTKHSDTEMSATLRAKVGPVSARCGGKVTISDRDPPNGCKITGEGTGGPAGFAKGGATVKLVDAPEGG